MNTFSAKFPKFPKNYIYEHLGWSKSQYCFASPTDLHFRDLKFRYTFFSLYFSEYGICPTRITRRVMGGGEFTRECYVYCVYKEIVGCPYQSC